MASRSRRRPVVDDPFPEDDDVSVLNEVNNSAYRRTQHIILSDDEDDSFAPPVPQPPGQLPVTLQPVVDLLHGRGVKPRTEWLVTCMNHLAASHSGFAQMPTIRKAEFCFEQFLMADLNVAGAASLPPSVHTLHATELPGPFVLQVDEIVDIGNSSRDRYQEKAAGPGRMLKLSLTDGVQRVSGIEYWPIRALRVLSSVGFKVCLRNVCIRRGLLMLVPEIVEILGGSVDHLEAARLRALEVINKPPRGRRVPRGVREPSLAERATRSAWPDEAQANSMNAAEGSHNSSGIRTPGASNSHRTAVSGRAQHESGQQGEVANLTRPSVQTTRADSFTRENERPAPVQSSERGENGEVLTAFIRCQSTTRSDVAHAQEYPLQQDTNSLVGGLSGRGSNTPRSAGREEANNPQLSRTQQENGQESAWQQENVSVTRQPSGVGTVQRVDEQRENSSHVPREVGSSRQSSEIKQSATRKVEVSTPSVSSQSPGAPLLSPSFGRLSLRSCRSTPTAVPPRPTNRPLSQPSDLLVGVGKFEYKGCDEFKLLLLIEDGTLITECSAAHKVVQDLIGHAPREVSSRLSDPDTRQEMLGKMIRFQKFLERFEGYMDLEFRNSSRLPVVVNIVEGVESSDAEVLLRRLDLLLVKQLPAGTQ
ncbi:hypothetical protein R1sor_002685 [Riccia sorocarpa]|uniref:RecQ-mediated genome instability protein 1 n=1 Tax=Riccia sorocarpa TaxID=122646 RepID=A0ABD3GZG8_9MARC